MSTAARTDAVGVGVIGTGDIGTYHARRLARRIAGARVAAVCDVAADRAAAVAAEVGARVCPDAETVIADAAVDAVVIASPGPTHAGLVQACLAAGKPVLCEKPLATTTADAAAVLAAEAAGGRRLVQVGFMRRYDRGYRAVKAALDAGEVGAPLVVHCVHRNVAAPPWFTSEMLPLDSVIHEIDAARWLLGSEIVAATVHTPRPSPLAAPGLQDPQLVTLETAAGAIVQVEMFVNARSGYEVRCEVVGSEGSVALEHAADAWLSRDRTRGRRLPGDWKARFDDAFQAELQAWVDAVAAGAPPPGASAWDGCAATAVATACVEALRSGQRTEVALPERPALYG
ncbi:MAG TPA: Gfo/Idh/MocA family oxidoreductase [Egibacteraceae bacterium]